MSAAIVIANYVIMTYPQNGYRASVGSVGSVGKAGPGRRKNKPPSGRIDRESRDPLIVRAKHVRSNLKKFLAVPEYGAYSVV